MEGTTTARIARLTRDWPQADICRVDGVWRAWIPSGWDRAVGTLAHGYTEDELLAKLDSAVR